MIKCKKTMSLFTTFAWGVSIVTLEHHTPSAHDAGLSYIVFVIALLVLSGGYVAALGLIFEDKVPS